MEAFGYILIFLAALLSASAGFSLVSYAYNEMKTDKTLSAKTLSLCGLIMGLMLITIGLGMISGAVFYD
jgi:hypothetical protein